MTSEAKTQDTDQTYQGWENYETWAVALWIDNDRFMYETSRDAARRLDDRTDLTNWLKAWIGGDSPLQESASLYSDLLTHALDRVDWYEVAKAFLDEVREE